MGADASSCPGEAGWKRPTKWEKTPDPSRNDALLMGLALVHAQNWLAKRPISGQNDREFIDLCMRRYNALAASRESASGFPPHFGTGNRRTCGRNGTRLFCFFSRFFRMAQRRESRSRAVSIKQTSRKERNRCGTAVARFRIRLRRQTSAVADRAIETWTRRSAKPHGFDQANLLPAP